MTKIELDRGVLEVRVDRKQHILDQTKNLPHGLTRGINERVASGTETDASARSKHCIWGNNGLSFGRGELEVAD